MTAPVVAFAGLTACSGCQLTLLNCERELEGLLGKIEIGYFPMGESGSSGCSVIDAAFVEGAVSTPEDIETLLSLRHRSRWLIALGTCAMWGGIATIKNHLPRTELVENVYGRLPGAMATFPPVPLGRFVTVDFSIPGCPPEKDQLLTTLHAISHGTLPTFPGYPVCTECRNRENRCLLIEDGLLCLGPLIQSGCNARCPAAGVVCEGCRGPAAESNVASEIELLVQKGFSREEIESRLHRFYQEWNDEQRY